MPWVPTATLPIVAVGALVVSYLVYARGWPPYVKGERIQWYSATDWLGDHWWALLGASVAFGSSIVAVALAASPPQPLACRGLSGIPWQLDAFHGFVGGYYILQIGFVPCMLWITRERQDPDSVALDVTRVLLWACALLQIAAAAVLGDIAACTGNSLLLAAFWFQVLPVLWTSLYDGVVYVRNISRIPTTSGNTATQQFL